MPDVTLFGFARGYVQMAGIVPAHKEVPYTFHDLESEMGPAFHLALHPFDRAPILRHGDFTVYETVAIVGYIDDVFESCVVTKNTVRPHASIGYRAPAPEVFVPALAAWPAAQS